MVQEGDAPPNSTLCFIPPRWFGPKGLDPRLCSTERGGRAAEEDMFNFNPALSELKGPLTMTTPGIFALAVLESKREERKRSEATPFLYTFAFTTRLPLDLDSPEFLSMLGEFILREIALEAASRAVQTRPEAPLEQSAKPLRPLSSKQQTQP